ncbi:MAG: molybdopterin-dependent oxidoreductase [Egibacteraceae bacterium]
MSGRRTNLALAVALAVAGLTGFAAFTAGTASGRWTVVLHGLAGLAVLVLSPWKSRVMRRGLRRRRPGRANAIALAVLTALVLVFGVGHSAGWRGLPAGLMTMQLHVGGAIVVMLLVAFHARQRPARPRPTDLSRRTVLQTSALVAGAGAGWVVLERSWALAGTPGADRRFTGSHEIGSGEPARMPVTQWLFDTVPRLDANVWRLNVSASTGNRQLTLRELEQLTDETGDRVSALLDCTGGWWSRQEWRGVRLDRLLGETPTGGRLLVSSATGYQRALPLTDASRLLLATRVGGQPLSAGHGFPARLVAHGRRGFWWVKWVTTIEVDERPWWAQPPLPLQ